MPLATRGNLVWLGMIVSGLALGAYVLVSWPDTSTRLIRLPYGESMPKTPRAAAPAPVVKDVQAAPNAGLTVADAEPEPARVRTTPVAAEAELVPEESPYELGAQPLPATAPAKPAEKQAAAAPEQQPAAAEPAVPDAAAEPQPDPAPAPDEPTLLEIIIGSSPPSGQE